MVLLGNDAQVEARYGLIGVVLNLMQNSCTVCAKHIIGAKIILGAPDGTPM
jgi:hypothetical protein